MQRLTEAKAMIGSGTLHAYARNRQLDGGGMGQDPSEEVKKRRAMMIIVVMKS